MSRRFAFALALVLFGLTSGAAAADGPTYLMSGWAGVTGPEQPVRFVTLPAGSETVLAAVRRSTGRVLQWRSLSGTWGIPMVANDGSAGGLSRDGRTLVVGNWTPPGSNGLRTVSRFALVNTRTFRVWRWISLRGDFSFDALSPGAGTLFLIQHVATPDTSSYRVRAYDIASRQLLPRVIADRRQSTWVMNGYPVSRATSANGRWVYTLYQQPDGFPFVHVLDAVRRTAVCVGIPWKGSQDALPTTRLLLDERAGTLTLQTRRGRPLFAVDTRTYWVTRPVGRPSSFPFAAVFAPLGGVTLLGLVVLLRRRLRPLGLKPQLR